MTPPIFFSIAYIQELVHKRLGLFFLHQLNIFYTHQLKWKFQIVLQLKLKYTHLSSHTIATVIVYLPPYCATSLSPQFIFTILWLLNPWFITTNNLLDGLASLCPREYPYIPNCVCAFFTVLNPYGLTICMVHAKREFIWPYGSTIIWISWIDNHMDHTDRQSYGSHGLAITNSMRTANEPPWQCTSIKPTTTWKEKLSQ